MCLNGITPAVRAQATPPPPTPVVLVDAKGVPLIASDGLRVNLGQKPLPVAVANSSLRVEVTNPSLAVAVRAIERGDAWDPIQVQVLRDPPTLKPVP